MKHVERRLATLPTGSAGWLLSRPSQLSQIAVIQHCLGRYRTISKVLPSCRGERRYRTSATKPSRTVLLVRQTAGRSSRCGWTAWHPDAASHRLHDENTLPGMLWRWPNCRKAPHSARRQFVGSPEPHPVKALQTSSGNPRWPPASRCHGPERGTKTSRLNAVFATDASATWPGSWAGRCPRPAGDAASAADTSRSDRRTAPAPGHARQQG